jgi:AICAR transformylase/IMP cyclohydrolase PurH
VLFEVGPPPLAWKAFQHCASYDSVVSEYLWSAIGEGKPAPERSVNPKPYTLNPTP